MGGRDEFQMKMNFSRDAAALIIAGMIAAIHVGLGLAGLPGWPCVFKAAVGLPCPGCGMTRATAALLRGEWQEALRLHAFAPLLVGAVGAMIVVALLPPETRARTVAKLHRLEARWHFGVWLLAALLGYWLLRFLLDGGLLRELSS